MKRFATFLILAVLAALPVMAQTNTGPVRYSNTSVIFNQPLCFESGPGTGPDVCLVRNAVNQLEVTFGDQVTQGSFLNFSVAPAAQPAAASPVAGVTGLSVTSGTGGAQSATTGNGAAGGPASVTGGVGGAGGSSSGTGGTGGATSIIGGVGGGTVTGGTGGLATVGGGAGGNGSSAGGTGGGLNLFSGAAGTGGTGTVGAVNIRSGGAAGTSGLTISTAGATTIASTVSGQNVNITPAGTGITSITNASLVAGSLTGYIGGGPLSSASLGGSPVTLTAAQCGEAFALDVASGVVYILPSTLPAPGCTYTFVVTTAVTSNSHEIESGNAAHFLEGNAIQLAPGGPTMRVDTCNGSSHIAYKSNGSTTGGLIGTRIVATVASSTLVWLDGIDIGSGTLATACSTSN